ncbi:Predicted kinase [Modicisalibacter muralis]|uniref:Predicted kinase n=1 Tax=Modicisalibacter muralis TaxID=119000 RepID=A0A1G9HVK6_9GAMM|nr:AAA family ATPase [Halomonas muralis]SDL16593.1 Predicted kinase [Halomonas muralis]
MLIVIGGLPGTGKTTIARELANRCQATYLRIDSIEQTLRNARVLADEVGASGYEVAWALARDNLNLGRTVIAECVNPLAISRDAWREVARGTSSPLLDVEIVCSDSDEHRRRIESRTSDISGLVLPTWEAVLAREYEPRSDERLVIDTATVSADEAAARVLAVMRAHGNAS